jgi:hypothetical protein
MKKKGAAPKGDGKPTKERPQGKGPHGASGINKTAMIEKKPKPVAD